MLRKGFIFLVDTRLFFRVSVHSEEISPCLHWNQQPCSELRGCLTLISTRIVLLEQSFFLLLMLESVGLFFMAESFTCSLQKINHFDHCLQFPASLTYD